MSNHRRGESATRALTFLLACAHRAAFSLQPLTLHPVWCLQCVQWRKISKCLIRNAELLFEAAHICVDKDPFCPLFMEYSNSWRKLQLTYWDFNCGELFPWQSFFKGGNKRPVRRPSALQLIINAEMELPAIDWAEMTDRAPKGSIWILIGGIVKS